MAARYDKYDGVAGGFRVESAAAVAEANFDRPVGLGINANGKGTVKAASQSRFKGVTIVDRTKRRAGDILDVMTNGEIVDVEGLDAGTTYFLDGTTGELTETETAYYVGHTVEAWRLVVRFLDRTDLGAA
jgi:hypothetical protein